MGKRIRLIVKESELKVFEETVAKFKDKMQICNSMWNYSEGHLFIEISYEEDWHLYFLGLQVGKALSISHDNNLL